jgi:hypothetical protein
MVAGVAGAGHVDLDARDRRAPTAEVPHVVPRLPGGGLDHTPREPALQREARDRLTDVLHVDVEVRRVQHEPPVRRIGGGDAVRGLGQARQGSVVDDLALFVAPGRVRHLVDLELRHVARHHAVEQAGGVGPLDHVLVEGRYVDDRGGLADRVVLDVVEVGIDRRGEVPGPVAPRFLRVQFLLARPERGPDAHDGPPGRSEAARVAERPSAAARWRLTRGQVPDGSPRHPSLPSGTGVGHAVEPRSG